MRSWRSRTAASGSTTASTCAASGARSSRTSSTRAWSRAARRSRSSSSRTRSTAIRRRLRARSARRHYAWQLERDPGGWSKQKILQEYLNTIYFGNGAYGIQQAALAYFQHGAKDLTLAESALLAGIPADPSRYDPVANPKAARERRRVVLQAMLDESKITPEQYETANATDLPDPDDVRLPGTEGPAQHFVNYVKQQLIDEYGQTKVFGGGLRVRTTIDLELQQTARDAISKWLTDADGPSAALVAIDPRDGAVRAMIGGNNYRKSQFNLAVQGVRQPGSSFKPFVLATALAPGDLAGDALRVGAAVDRPRRPGLGRRQLRRRLLRQRRPREGDGRVRQRRLRPADAARRLEEGRRDGEAARDPEQARRLLRDRARRGGRDAARARARVRDDRQRRRARRRVDLRQPAARDRRGHAGGPQAGEQAARVQGDDADAGRGRQHDPAAGRRATAPASGRISRTGPSPARPARPRTTATPGSSATRRSSSSRSGSGTRRR